MTISKIWRPRGGVWDKVIPNYCSLLEAAYLVNGLNPPRVREDFQGEVLKALREMKTGIMSNPGRYQFPYVNYNLTPFIRDDTPPESIMVNVHFVCTWADYFGVTDFFKQPALKHNDEPPKRPKKDIDRDNDYSAWIDKDERNKEKSRKDTIEALTERDSSLWSRSKYDAWHGRQTIVPNKTPGIKPKVQKGK